MRISLGWNQFDFGNPCDLRTIAVDKARAASIDPAGRSGRRESQGPADAIHSGVVSERASLSLSGLHEVHCVSFPLINAAASERLLVASIPAFVRVGNYQKA